MLARARMQGSQRAILETPYSPRAGRSAEAEFEVPHSAAVRPSGFSGNLARRPAERHTLRRDNSCTLLVPRGPPPTRCARAEDDYSVDVRAPAPTDDRRRSRGGRCVLPGVASSSTPEVASSANPGHVDRHMGRSRARRVGLDQLDTESGQLSPNRLAGLVREVRRPREQSLVVGAAVVCLS